jgi:hypothetical protein
VQIPSGLSQLKRHPTCALGNHMRGGGGKKLAFAAHLGPRQLSGFVTTEPWDRVRRDHQVGSSLTCIGRTQTLHSLPDATGTSAHV